MDDISEGTVLGTNAASINVTSGFLNNALHFNNPGGNLVAHFNLGYYPSTLYCFPEPQRCPRGVTFAFWLNILGNNNYHGFLTTATENGPGFTVFWDNYDNGDLIFQVKRNSDTKLEMVGMDYTDFLQTFGFNIWVHYIVTYKYEGPGINMKVYFNGEISATVWTYIKPWTNGLNFDGRLELGLIELDDPYWGTGHMKFDDLIIWEEEIPCDDAFRLYQAYNV